MVYYWTSNLDIKEDKNKQRRTASERKGAKETYQHEFHFSVFLNWSWTRLLKKKMFTHKHSQCQSPMSSTMWRNLDLAKSSINKSLGSQIRILWLKSQNFHCQYGRQVNPIERRSVTSRYHGSTISGWQQNQRRLRRQGERQKIRCLY